MEDKIRTKAATGVGGEPEEDWDQIGERIERHLKVEVAKCADAEPDDDWDTIGHNNGSKDQS